MIKSNPLGDAKFQKGPDQKIRALFSCRPPAAVFQILKQHCQTARGFYLQIKISLPQSLRYGETRPPSALNSGRGAGALQYAKAEQIHGATYT